MLKILFTLKDPQKAILNLLDGHTVDILRNEEPLLPMVEKGNYNLIMLEGGIDLIPSIKAADPRVEVILFGERQEILQLKQYGKGPLHIFRLRLRSRDSGRRLKILMIYSSQEKQVQISISSLMKNIHFLRRLWAETRMPRYLCLYQTCRSSL